MSKNPKTYQVSTSFPQRFSKAVLQCALWCPHTGKCTEGWLSVFVLHLKTFNIKNSLTSSLDISFTVLGRDGYGKSSLESSIRSAASVLINTYFLWAISRNASRGLLVVCSRLSFSAYDQTGNRGTFWLQRPCQLRRGGVLCHSVRGKISYFNVCCKPYS